jgi:hypothetical protein
MKMKTKRSISIVIWTALSLIFDILICMQSKLLKISPDEKHLTYMYINTFNFLENPSSYQTFNTSSSSVYRSAGVCEIDSVLLSSVVMMSTTSKSLMSPSDLVLPATNNEKAVYRLAGVYRIDPVLPSSVVMMSTTPESSLMSLSDLVLPTNNENCVCKEKRYKPMLKMIKDAAVIFLQPQIDLAARVRLCKLRCIQNQYLHQDFFVLLSKLQLYAYKMIWFLAYMSPPALNISKQYISLPVNLDLKKGGGVNSKHTWSKNDLEPYTFEQLTYSHYKYMESVRKNDSHSHDCIQVNMPLHKLAGYLPILALKELCKLHGIYYSVKEYKKAILQAKLESHACKSCPEYIALFTPVDILSATQRSQKYKAQLDEHEMAKFKAYHKKWNQNHYQSHLFPPKALKSEQVQNIVNNFVLDSNTEFLDEKGCAVCGCLVATRDLRPLSDISSKLDVLCNTDATCKPRSNVKDPIEHLNVIKFAYHAH